MASKEVAVLANKMTEVATQMQQSVLTVFGAQAKEGFERAYIVADAVDRLQTLLAPEYMKPIMKLQGTKLGFKTDKDDKGGYNEETVRNCLIEAVLTGLQPVGNHFNIISNNCYTTKEGFGYLLKNIPNLSYDIVSDLPRINNDKSGAAVSMHLTWSFTNLPNSSKNKKLEIAVKMNAYMGVDGIIGKAIRKSRAWLYNTITGSEISDGDIQDMVEVKGYPSASELVGNKDRSAALNQQAENLVTGQK